MRRVATPVAVLLVALGGCTADAGMRNIAGPESTKPLQNHVSYVNVCCSKTVYRGTTTTMEAFVYDGTSQRLFNAGVFWTHSANGVASTTGTGDVVYIDAVAVGTTTIYAEVEGKIGSATLTVIERPVVTTVTITPSPVTVQVGRSRQLTAKAYDQNGNLMSGTTATWSIDNSSVASVSSSGSVQGVAVGSTTVRATINGVTGTASVTVEPYFYVAVDGPTAVFSAGTYQWTANPTGGSGSYTYQWFVEQDGIKQALGTGSTQTLWIDENTPGYTILTVKVTSGAQVEEGGTTVCNFISSMAC